MTANTAPGGALGANAASGAWFDAGAPDPLGLSTTLPLLDLMRGSAVYEAVADADRKYRHMRATVPQLAQPTADRLPLTDEQAAAVAAYRVAEGRLAQIRRELSAYSCLTA